MDPFSITVGVVGLADAGTSLAGFLTEKYKAYRDAPELILEIAHEVEFCAGLVDMFGSSLDRSGMQYPKRFVRDAKVLVEKTQNIFKDIERLIPQDRDFDATFSRARWHFVLDKKKLLEKQQRLRQVQQMYLFMESMHRLHYSSTSSSSTTKPGSGAGVGTGAMGVNTIEKPNASVGGQNQTLTGLLQQEGPVQMTGTGADGQTFQVTLTLSPIQIPESRRASTTVPGLMPYSSTSDMGELPETRMARSRSSNKPERSKQGEKRLEGLRQSPFFDMSLFGERKPARSATTTYAEMRMKDETGPLSENIKSRADWERAKVEERRREEASVPRWNLVDKKTARKDIDDLSRLWFDDSDGTDDLPSQDSPSYSHDASLDEEFEVLATLPPNEQPYYLDQSEEMPYRPGARGSYPPAPSPIAPGNMRRDLGPPPPPPLAPARTPPKYDPRSGRPPPPPLRDFERPYPTPDPKHSRYSMTGSVQGQDVRGQAVQRASAQIICDSCDREIRPSYPRMRCRTCPPSFDLCAHCFANPDTTLKHTHPKSHFVRESVSD